MFQIFFKEKTFTHNDHLMQWKSTPKRKWFLFIGVILEIASLILWAVFVGKKDWLMAFVLAGASVFRSYFATVQFSIGAFIGAVFLIAIFIDIYTLWDSFRMIEIDTEKKTLYIKGIKKTRKYSVDDKITLDISFRKFGKNREVGARIVYEKEENVLYLHRNAEGYDQLKAFFKENFPQRITTNRYKGLF